VRVLAILILLTGPVFASDGIPTTGVLTDADFLRLVSCGAVPGGPCIDAAPRWDDPGDLTVGFGPVPKGYPDDKTALASAALDRAIAAINDVGSGVRLRRVDHAAPHDITVRPTRFRENDAIFGEAGFADGTVIGAGHVFVTWDDRLAITGSTILIAQDILPGDIEPIMLEELTQSLGFLFDIENPAYENRSIFAQDSNTVLTLTGQDAAILRLHYPN
jgi:hypothetical protein